MTSSHTLDRLNIAFDDPRLIANAGLLLPLTLARHLELPELLRDNLDLGDREGNPNREQKAMSLLAALLAGGDCIDDANVLRAGRSELVVGNRVSAPSTLGIFLRCFTWGHNKQLERVTAELLRRAWATGAGPGSAQLTIDIDPTICETYGLLKQGGSRFTYQRGVRGYHPLLAIAADTSDIIHCRLRGGPASSGRGAASFVKETVQRARHAGAQGQIVLRMDAGFFSHKVVEACQGCDARFSITVTLNRRLHRAIAEIREEAWTPIPYWLEGAADVAEVLYMIYPPNHGKPTEGTPVRLIIRRVQPTPGSQLQLQGVLYTYHAFVTDRQGPTLELEADHRRHAVVENGIRDLKHGLALNHLPSGRFAANAAWLTFNVMAHNLLRWLTRLGLGDPLLGTKTLRYRLLALPARLARSGRRVQLHLPADWPWADVFANALQRLRVVVISP